MYRIEPDIQAVCLGMKLVTPLRVSVYIPGIHYQQHANPLNAKHNYGILIAGLNHMQSTNTLAWG